MSNQPKSAVPPAQFTTIADAEQAISQFDSVMQALLKAIEAETELVRAGRLTEVVKLESTKAELAREYTASAAAIKANTTFLKKVLPDQIRELRIRHERFLALLQINMTVLATAHAVAERIMRGLSSELARQTTPKTYGARGHQSAYDSRYAQPIAVSRSL